jgi:ADP-heptose:LPS heptosyltransferase
LRSEHYDAVIDTQGLFKSALLAHVAQGRRHGFDAATATAWRAAAKSRSATNVASTRQTRRAAAPDTATPTTTAAAAVNRTRSDQCQRPMDTFGHRPSPRSR